MDEKAVSLKRSVGHKLLQKSWDNLSRPAVPYCEPIRTFSSRSWVLGYHRQTVLIQFQLSTKTFANGVADQVLVPGWWANFSNGESHAVCIKVRHGSLDGNAITVTA